MSDEKFMREALKEAKKAYEKEEVPVGAVIVMGDKIIARAHNLKETKNNATAHAEILAINKASKKLNNWRLSNCTMYVTLEPCNMCKGAIREARLKEVVVGTLDPKSKEYNLELTPGVLAEECEEILKKFFKELRK